MTTTDTQHTADLANASGLFGSTPPPPAKPQPKPQTTSKAPVKHSKTTKPKPQATKISKIPDNSPQTNQPLHSTEVNLPQNATNQPENDLPDIPEENATLSIFELDLSDKSSIFAAIKAAKSGSQKWHLSTLIKDRYSAAARAETSRASKSTDLISREELLSIVTNAVRDPSATEQGINSLTKVLQQLQPELFASAEAGSKPDPGVVLAYVSTFGGRTGSEIVAELGGADFVAGRLSEVLGIPVRLGDSAC